jgi:hypothetical protein
MSSPEINGNAQRVTMSGVAAALVTLVIILPCLLIGFLSPAVSMIMVVVAVISTSLWITVDSSHLKVREYKSQVVAYPFVLFTASLGLWIVIFPVYLVVRSKIQAGLLPKAANRRERFALYTCIAMWSVLVLTIIATIITYHMAQAVMRNGISAQA